MEFVKLAGPAGMFFIMFSLALSLKTSAFKAIVSNPLSFYLGLVLQLIGMPLIGFIIALSVPFPVEVKVGIVLITCLPSAVTSNYLSKKMGGDVALSISLTAVSSLIAFLTIPIIIKIYFYFVIQDQSIIIFQTSLIGTSFKLFAIDKANLEFFVPFTVSDTCPVVPDDKTDLDLKFKADSKNFP